MPGPHEAPFLAAVLADPDDDGPRLIYADWLEEHGDVARAEFIRVQIALARAPQGDRRRPAWEARERALLAAHRDAWLGPLRGLFYLSAFRRGFLEEVTLPARLFLDHAAAIADAAPVRLVRLLNAAGVVGALAGCPHLGRVAALHLTDNRIGDRGARALAASPHLAGLTALRLGGNDIGDAGAEALAASPHLAGLTALNLSRNDIGDAGARALAASQHLSGLTALDLSSNRLSDLGARALAESAYLRGLRVLDLSNAPLPYLSPPGRQNLIGTEQKLTLRNRFGSHTCRF